MLCGNMYVRIALNRLHGYCAAPGMVYAEPMCARWSMEFGVCITTTGGDPNGSSNDGGVYDRLYGLSLVYCHVNDGGKHKLGAHFQKGIRMQGTKEPNTSNSIHRDE